MKSNIVSLWQWLRDEKRTVWFEYSALSLVILLPLLLPGYILTLDLVFTPNAAWPQELTNTYPLEVLLWMMQWILPGDVIEKIILFLILLLSGVGMHKLLQSVKVKSLVAPDIYRAALYFAGIFYMINPFTYSRFMAGQWMVLVGYALLPFFVRALLRLLALPSWSSALRVAGWGFVIVTASIHHAGILFLLGMLAVLVASTLRYWRSAAHVRRFLGWAGLSILLLVMLSSFWLVPTLLGQGTIGEATTNFDQAHFAAFQTNASGALGPLGDVIRLQGFWAEPRQLYTLPQSLVPGWGLVFLLVWVLVGVGAVKAWQKHRMVVSFGLGCIVLGGILAATPVVSWLGQLVPFVSGYREPHKFANLITLGYAMLGAFGVVHSVGWARKRFGTIVGQVATIGCLLLPLIVTPTMLWGFTGQLSPRTYSGEWHDMNNTLKTTPDVKRVLLLPWHQYQKYSFSGRIIANPAEKFFEVPMIISDEPEFRDVPPTIPNEEKRAISASLKQTDTLVDTLRTRGVSHVLLAKEPDEEIDYGYLDRQENITVVSENQKLKLYKVEQ